MEGMGLWGHLRTDAYFWNWGFSLLRDYHILWIEATVLELNKSSSEAYLPIY